MAHAAADRPPVDDRREQQRVEQRQAIIELYDAGTRWTASANAIHAGMATLPDVTQLAELNVWTDHIANTSRYRRAMAGALLIVSERDLAKIVEGLSKQLAEVATITGSIFENRMAAGDPAAAVAYSFEYTDDVDNLLEQLADRARSRLSPLAEASPGPLRRAWPRRRARRARSTS